MKAIVKTPKRVAKNMRKLLRNDVKLANTDKMLTLAEYNYFFDTNYSFEDVFGKENVEKATAEKLKYYENYWLLYIDIDHYLPDDDYKRTALTFIVNFLYNDFSEFEEILDEEVSLVLYDDRTIRGKDAVASYWRSILAKENDRNKDVDYRNAFIKKLSTPLARCVYSALTLHGYKAIEYNFHYQHYKNYDKN